jgi:hypothetical protein
MCKAQAKSSDRLSTSPICTFDYHITRNDFSFSRNTKFAGRNHLETSDPAAPAFRRCGTHGRLPALAVAANPRRRKRRMKASLPTLKIHRRTTYRYGMHLRPMLSPAIALQLTLSLAL